MTFKQQQDRVAQNGHLAGVDPDEPILPGDHSSTITRDPMLTTASQARRVLKVIERSGLVSELERRLRRHPGKPSRLTIKALLLGILLNAELSETYLRTDICSVLNGLHWRIKMELGLWDSKNRDPITYTMVVKQIQRLEVALIEVWYTSDDAQRDLDWICHTFLAAAIPTELKTNSTAISLDWTALETNAVTKDFRTDQEVRDQHSQGDTDPETTPPAGAIGSLDSQKRLIRSADPDARGGYRTATNKRPAGGFTGYDVHIATVNPNANWYGDPTRISLGETPPPFITHIAVVPATTNPAATGLNAVRRSRQILPGLEEAIVDIGYAQRGEAFIRPLRFEGINVVRDFSKGQQGKPDYIPGGRKKQDILSKASTLSETFPKDSRANPTTSPEVGKNRTSSSVAAPHS